MLEKRNDKVQRACHGRSVLDWLPKPCRVIRCDHSQEIIYKQRRSGATVDVVQHNAVHEDVSSSSCQSPNSSTVSRSNDIGTGHKYKSEELRLFSHKCIMSYTVKSNRRKFWYCAHDPLLVPRLLRKRGAPVILMEHNIFRICEPSNRSKERHEYLEAAKSDVPDWEKSAMNVGKVVETVGARKVKKRRRADAPDTKSEELTSLEPSKKRSRSKSRRVKKPTD
ncbi:hypothetical protein GNI_167790 [Gregarina niphandrodes]|uniref:Uncharacterized protein n=1 Tax=Gregarina niphandrodes TaxID=110365 RepID=A0A023AY25_GRENI|nr:hypothetical protein GNI_167790 [Gregarina niphandrodes]EZG43547.1 hypothetical protein GNI_167790 [Gregarina niphandrodes]|eukprot:XP_011133232.1 hypothetical protein GNI_167790 [Gregarina niphandrodes]